MQRIRKGDEVVVITGKNKGARGTVLKFEGIERVVVEGINLIKKHQRGNPQANQPGGIIEREASIHISNVMLFNAANKRGERVGFKVLEDGRKVRIYKSTGEVVDA